jgi:ApaG protein
MHSRGNRKGRAIHTRWANAPKSARRLAGAVQPPYDGIRRMILSENREHFSGSCAIGANRSQAMYKAVTRGIQVTVRPEFLEQESTPRQGRFFWAYTVEIANLGMETVQLKTRHWRIVDGDGKLQEVRGAGVVGEEPVLKPGETFTYTSGCPLATPHGSMSGEYHMHTQDGESFPVTIPAFPLDSPHAKRVVH